MVGRQMRSCREFCLFALLVVLLAGAVYKAAAATRRFDWKIQYTNVTRLCHTKTLVSVNGEFPGPTSYVREGDTVIVNVTNLVSYNVTIHWHGVQQLLSAWADGPAYVTQCPIQTGASYVHQFKVVDQRGTLFWHAHIAWLRATLYGGFIILPKKNVGYPFRKPAQEFVISLGEWWNANEEDVLAEALAMGDGYRYSNALTINGQPGFQYKCSSPGTEVFNVTKGQTYLLRLINAALNFQLFFSVANHSLTVVEADAAYTKPYDTNVVLLAPGQTSNVLLTADQEISQYTMGVTIFSPAPEADVPFTTTPATAILKYNDANASSNIAFQLPQEYCTSANKQCKSAFPLPEFPAFDDSDFAENFRQSLRCLSNSSGNYNTDVPFQVDEDLLYTVGYGSQPCTAGELCPIGYHIAASVNNVSFVPPSISILQAFYNHISGVYEADLPDHPLYQYNYTGPAPSDKALAFGTKVKVLDFNTTVQLVYQDISTLFFESHPFHLHGQNFWVVGTGFGTYDPASDPANFNLVDPPSRNTISVPSAGWAAVRFRATNPGVWYMHCHIDMHNSWGMATAFVVKNGHGPHQTLPPPPSDLPPC